MPKGARSLFNDFIKVFNEFKIQLQNIIKGIIKTYKANGLLSIDLRDI